MTSLLTWLKGGLTLPIGFEVPSPVFSYILLREKTGLASKQEQLSIFFKVFGEAKRQSSMVQGMECFLLSFDCLCFREIFSFFWTLIAQSSQRISYWVRQPQRLIRLDRHSPKFGCRRPSWSGLRSFIAQLKLVYLLYPQILKESFCGGTSLSPETHKLNTESRASHSMVNDDGKPKLQPIPYQQFYTFPS